MMLMFRQPPDGGSGLQATDIAGGVPAPNKRSRLAKMLRRQLAMPQSYKTSNAAILQNKTTGILLELTKKMQRAIFNSNKTPVKPMDAAV